MLIKFFDWLKGKDKKPKNLLRATGIHPRYAMGMESDHLSKKHDMSDYVNTDVMISTINFDHHFYRSEDTSYHDTHSDTPSDSSFDCSTDCSSDCGSCD